MIRLEDRQKMSQLVAEAHASGARLEPACLLAGIDVRTLQRWKVGNGLVVGDKRPPENESASRPLKISGDHQQLASSASANCC